jgi:Holliday junction DNA helicase RuvB
MNFRLQFYNNEELAKIITIAANKLNKKIENKSALEIAKRSRGTPRIALRLLKRVRDFSDVAAEKIITLKTTKYALNKLGVNENGFDELDLSYLKILCNAKKPLGLSTISAALSEDEDTIEDVIEPFLLANGYIEKTARGRIATRKSYELLNFKERSLFD